MVLRFYKKPASGAPPPDYPVFVVVQENPGLLTPYVIYYRELEPLKQQWAAQFKSWSFLVPSGDTPALLKEKRIFPEHYEFYTRGSQGAAVWGGVAAFFLWLFATPLAMIVVYLVTTWKRQ